MFYKDCQGRENASMFMILAVRFLMCNPYFFRAWNVLMCFHFPAAVIQVDIAISDNSLRSILLR
jgi:hypothetical protein